MEGRLRAAGILEFGGVEAGALEAPFRFLDKQVRTVLPGMPCSRAERWMGHRSILVGSLPMIGEIDKVKGTFTAFGHHHVGLTGATVTGRLLAQLISGRKPNIDLANYSPMRFQ